MPETGMQLEDRGVIGCCGTHTPRYGETLVRLCNLDDMPCTYEGEYLNECPRADTTGIDLRGDMRRDES